MPMPGPGAQFLKNPVHLAALGLGAGLMPWLPGTAGTAVGVCLYLLLPVLPPVSYLILLAGLFACGVPICAHTARALGVHDHPAIVYDEIVGYLVTMFMAPAGWVWMVTGFVLFRLFDIWKPWPIRWLDRRVTGGFGIMLDDLAAGVLAMLGVQILSHVQFSF